MGASGIVPSPIDAGEQGAEHLELAAVHVPAVGEEQVADLVAVRRRVAHAVTE
jgi:hypothetical protein